MAQEYYGLSEATKETLTDNVKRIAIAWDKSTRWVQRILSEGANDWFAYFLSMYTAVAKAGLSTSHWDAELEFVRNRWMKKLSPDAAIVSFKSKLHSQHETLEKWVEFMEDGQLSCEEIEELERLLVREQDGITLAMQSLKFQKEKLNQGGPRAIA